MTQPKPNITLDDILCMGVSEDVASQFLWLRKQQKKPVTQLALKKICSEAVKARMTLEEVLTMICEEGWQGFKAEWVKPKMVEINSPDYFLLRHTDTSWADSIN